MSGPVALHGGGEFLEGDEPFLAALLRAAAPSAEDRARSCGRAGPYEPLRVVIVPTAAAAHDPDGAARLGRGAFQGVADRSGRPVATEVARVVDAATAEDPVLAARLAAADLVYLPGGDPAVIPDLLPATAAWRAILAARARGAVLAGASAGAMALGPRTWTPSGIVTGLSVVRGLVVFPHADAATWSRHATWFPTATAAGMGILGLGERTGVISEGPGSDPHRASTTWRVVGQREVRWLRPGSNDPVVYRDGDALELTA